MGRVIDNGHPRAVGPVSRHESPPKSGWAQRKFYMGNQGALSAYGPVKIEAVERDLATVRAQFDVNTSDALRLALHLLAKAIREGKMDIG